MHFSFSRGFIIKTLAALLLFVFLSQRMMTAAALRPFHEDEVTTLERAQFVDTYVAGDFKNKLWMTIPSYDEPLFSFFFYGIVLHREFGEPVHSILMRYHFLDNGDGKAGSWRLQYSRNFCCTIHDLPRAIQTKITPILAARAGSIYVTLLSLVLIFCVGLALCDYVYGLLAMGIIGMNPLFADAMVTAMGENLLICLSLLFFLVSMLTYRKILARSRSGVLSVVLLGIIGGLDIATKFNGGISLLFFTCFTFVFVLKNKLSWLSFFAYQCILYVTAFDIFAILDPFVWKNPLYNTIYMLVYRFEVFHSQQAVPLFTNNALTTIPDRAQIFFLSFFATGAPFANFSFKASPWPIDLFLFLLGSILLSKQLWNKYIPISWKFRFIFASASYSVPINKMLLFALWSLTWLVVMICYIPLNWGRYWLPLVIVVGLVQCFALITLFHYLLSFFKRRLASI